jgi:hypothetical protein
VTRLAGLTVTIIGAVGAGRDEDLMSIARGDSESWRLLPQAWVVVDEYEVNRIRLLVGERAIVGGLVMGDQTLLRPLSALVAAQADITPIRAALADPTAVIPTLLNFYQHWERTHYAEKL